MTRNELERICAKALTEARPAPVRTDEIARVILDAAYDALSSNGGIVGVRMLEMSALKPSRRDVNIGVSGAGSGGGAHG